jgi:simple sugar transport system ATP-binding protein
VTAALELREITRKFGNVTALDGVNFSASAGKVTALVGENGAGKSTLMAIAAGAMRPDSGEISAGGETVSFARPLDALSRGIGLVYQHTRLVPALSCAENIALGAPPSRFGLIDAGALEDSVREIFERIRLDRETDTPLSALTIPERQKVEIARFLYRGAKTLLLDEPTALLLPHETKELFDVLREETARGSAVVFVSHRLEEVFDIADGIFILRRGRLIGQRKRDETTPEEVSTMMVGSLPEKTKTKPPHTGGETFRFFENVTVKRPGERRAGLVDFTLDVMRGSIHGIAGVAGNGQEEMYDLLAGVVKPVSGAIPVRSGEVAGVPGDRFGQGGIAGFTLSENVALAHANMRSEFFLRREAASLAASGVIKDFDVRDAEPDMLYGSLSGGNAQKFLVGRELAKSGTPITCLFNPTRGIDFASRDYLHARIAAAAGTVILISYDLGELLELSDFITVLYRGKNRGTFTRDEVSLESLAALMTGGGP